MLEPKTGLLVLMRTACPLIAQLGRGRPREGRVLAQGHAGGQQPRPQHREGVLPRLPSSRAQLLQSAALLAGVRIPSPRLPSSSVHQSAHQSGSLHCSVVPSPASGAAQGEAGRWYSNPRPTPVADGSACARGPPAGVRESRRPRRGSRPATRSLAPSPALCAQEKPSRGSPGDLPSKMKKLQEPVFCKVGHEGRGAPEGCAEARPLSSPWEGWRGHLGTWLRALGEAG